MEGNVSVLLSSHRSAILDAWHQRILLDFRSVAALLGSDATRAQCRAIFDHLIAGLGAESPPPTDRVLEDLCGWMANHQLTPAETTLLVLSLKRPLISVLGDALSGGELIEAITVVDHQVDTLAVGVFSSYLALREATIAGHRQAFEEISAPVVRIWDQIILIPLVGMLDSERTQLMMETLLSSLEAIQARVAILDISGIPVVDTLVARHLVTAASAVRLMGAECIITGIRARIAQTLVELGVDLGGLMTRTTLADGLAASLKLTNQSIG